MLFKVLPGRFKRVSARRVDESDLWALESSSEVAFALNNPEICSVFPKKKHLFITFLCIVLFCVFFFFLAN